MLRFYIISIHFVPFRMLYAVCDVCFIFLSSRAQITSRLMTQMYRNISGVGRSRKQYEQMHGERDENKKKNERELSADKANSGWWHHSLL